MRRWLRSALVAAGILVAIVAGILWFLSANLRFRTAWSTSAQGDMVGILGALEDWSINNDGAYPDSLEALVVLDENGKHDLNMLDVPVDPWGREYLYLRGASPELPFALISFGSDGIPGGTGQKRDLLSWDLQARRR